MTNDDRFAIFSREEDLTFYPKLDESLCIEVNYSEFCTSGNGWWPVRFNSCNRSHSHQRWSLFAAYTFIHWSTGKCLDLPSADTTNGNGIILYQCNGGVGQQWWVDSNGYIRSAANPHKCSKCSIGPHILLSIFQNLHSMSIFVYLSEKLLETCCPPMRVSI